MELPRPCPSGPLPQRFVSCRGMDIKGAAAIVTGGASGLGEATARRLKAAGALVTILDFNGDKGDALAKELGVKFVKADVTDADQVAEAVAVAAEDAPLRVGVNCAGTGTAVRTSGSARRNTSCPFHLANVPTRPIRMPPRSSGGRPASASRSSAAPAGAKRSRSTAL